MVRKYPLVATGHDGMEAVGVIGNSAASLAEVVYRPWKATRGQLRGSRQLG